MSFFQQAMIFRNFLWCPLRKLRKKVSQYIPYFKCRMSKCRITHTISKQINVTGWEFPRGMIYACLWCMASLNSRVCVTYLFIMFIFLLLFIQSDLQRSVKENIYISEYRSSIRFPPIFTVHLRCRILPNLIYANVIIPSV